MKPHSEIKIFGILFVLLGSFGLMVWARLPQLFLEHARNIEQVRALLASDEGMIVRSVHAVITLLTLGAGCGLLLLKKWGYWLVLLVTGLEVLWAVPAMLIESMLVGGANIFRLVFALCWSLPIFLYFLLRHSVRAQFQRKVST